MAAPAISVILPAHNLEGHVGAAIASLRAQHFTDFEAIIINDGSTDATGRAAQAAIAGDTRFRLVAQAHQGLSVARNTGLEQARGATIAFLDGDDQFAPEFLACHHRALLDSGAGWSACAVTLVWPDGRSAAHSALHGAPQPEGAPRWIALDDARTVATLWPSAWNKLMRRDLIGPTRFRPGALFEDHPFFWELATRAGRIRYLPQPLYRYTRGRPGQITDSADRGMFQQLDRLREVAQLLRPSRLSHQREGLSLLATRVIHERLAPPAPPDLKADFVASAAQLMAEEGLVWDRNGAPEITPEHAPRLDPTLRLHVGVLCAKGADPAATLDALAAQSLPVWQISMIADEGEGLTAALIGLARDSAAAPWVSVLRAGDLPGPDWALCGLEFGRASGAQSVIASAQHRVGRGFHDSGMADPVAGLAAPDPACLMLRRAAAADLPRALEQLPDVVAAACLAALTSAQALPAGSALLQLGPREARALGPLAKALARTQPALCPLSGDARACVFAHLAQIEMARQPSRARRLGVALTAGWARRSAGLPPPRALPQLGPILQACLGRSA